MDLEQAIQLLKTTVKNNGTNDSKHMDLTLVPTDKKHLYDKALIVSQLAIQEGKITKDEFKRLINLEN